MKAESQKEDKAVVSGSKIGSFSTESNATHMTKNFVLATVISGTAYVIGDDGASCDTACASEGMTCDFTGMYELGDYERETRMRATVNPITSAVWFLRPFNYLRDLCLFLFGIRRVVALTAVAS